MILGTIAPMLAGIVMLYICSTITTEKVNKALEKQNNKAMQARARA